MTDTMTKEIPDPIQSKMKDDSNESSESEDDSQVMGNHDDTFEGFSASSRELDEEWKTDLFEKKGTGLITEEEFQIGLTNGGLSYDEDGVLLTEMGYEAGDEDEDEDDGEEKFGWRLEDIEAWTKRYEDQQATDEEDAELATFSCDSRENLQMWGNEWDISSTEGGIDEAETTIHTSNLEGGFRASSPPLGIAIPKKRSADGEAILLDSKRLRIDRKESIKSLKQSMENEQDNLPRHTSQDNVDVEHATTIFPPLAGFIPAIWRFFQSWR